MKSVSNSTLQVGHTDRHPHDFDLNPKYVERFLRWQEDDMQLSR